VGTGFWDSGLAGGCGGHRCMGASPRLPLGHFLCIYLCMSLEGICRMLSAASPKPGTTLGAG
jgi:hypothetical protein